VSRKVKLKTSGIQTFKVGSMTYYVLDHDNEKVLCCVGKDDKFKRHSCAPYEQICENLTSSLEDTPIVELSGALVKILMEVQTVPGHA
jgi:hypothetical protein